MTMQPCFVDVICCLLGAFCQVQLPGQRVGAWFALLETSKVLVPLSSPTAEERPVCSESSCAGGAVILGCSPFWRLLYLAVSFYTSLLMSEGHYIFSYGCGLCLQNILRLF